jgi:nitrate/nitrite transport system substrate-binding protein
MKRRSFIQYSSLGVASSVIAACAKTSQPTLTSNEQPKDVNFGTLEKTNLTIGYVSMTDAAPLIVAQEKGFFSRYGLSVTLRKQANWNEIEKGLVEWRLDAAHAPYGMPLQARLSSQETPILALMVLNLNGSAIALTPKTWQAQIRSSSYYNTFSEFADAYRQYLRSLSTPPSFYTDSSVSMDAYLFRYWFAAMGILPDEEVKLDPLTPSQLIYKLQEGSIYGYCVGEPWNQDAVLKKAGFIAYASRDIWKGHPGKILATMQGWSEKNPTTARALVAALLEACQYCDRSENSAEIAQILAQNQYFNLNSDALAPSLNGNYNYSLLTSDASAVPIPDFTVFHFKPTDYLKSPNHANYPWRSQAVWLLTQMIRWNQIESQEYPKDADKLLDKAYPVTIYEEVAKALKIELPSDRMKKEAGSAFIDNREFDPAQPVAYLNQFELRAERRSIFSLV